jgi:acetolactate synthase small subunit
MVRIQWRSMLTFVIYVRRTPEVLGRVVSLFHRRRINIDSLTAVCARGTDTLRMTIALEADQDQLRSIEANLYKLVDVLLVESPDLH